LGSSSVKLSVAIPVSGGSHGTAYRNRPDIIIQRYRERAEQYRQLAEASAKHEAFLRLAAIYDSLAEGMTNIREAREATTADLKKLN
jgi:hypothetical protein